VYVGQYKATQGMGTTVVPFNNTQTYGSGHDLLTVLDRILCPCKLQPGPGTGPGRVLTATLCVNAPSTGCLVVLALFSVDLSCAAAVRLRYRCCGWGLVQVWGID
jgi:hypothetical protein